MAQKSLDTQRLTTKRKRRVICAPPYIPYIIESNPH